MIGQSAHAAPGARLVRRAGDGWVSRHLAGSTPAKLRLLLACVVALIVLWGGVTASTVAAQAAAIRNATFVSEPLSLDAESIYRSLSDADATEAAAFLHGGLEPFALRRRYLADIGQAARELEAATAAAGHSAAGSQLAAIASELPVYTGLVETARADNRLGLPLGAAYLREASGLMRSTLLPAAKKLYARENARLSAVEQQSAALPYAAAAVALSLALALVYAQWWLARRSRRTLNTGLLIASVAGLATLTWVFGSLSAARGDLLTARDRGSAPVEALAKADIAVLRAHADESLTLIDRSGDDAFQEDFLVLQTSLGPGPGTLLTRAANAARGSPGGHEAAVASHAAPYWFAVHRHVRLLDDSGDYRAAVNLAIGTGPHASGGEAASLDSALTSAIRADQGTFRSAAQAGQGDLADVEAVVIMLTLAMAGLCVWGISRRLAEFR